MDELQVQLVHGRREVKSGSNAFQHFFGRLGQGAVSEVVAPESVIRPVLLHRRLRTEVGKLIDNLPALRRICKQIPPVGDVDAGGDDAEVERRHRQRIVERQVRGRLPPDGYLVRELAAPHAVDEAHEHVVVVRQRYLLQGRAAPVAGQHRVRARLGAVLANEHLVPQLLEKVPIASVLLPEPLQRLPLRLRLRGIADLPVDLRHLRPGPGEVAAAAWRGRSLPRRRGHLRLLEQPREELLIVHHVLAVQLALGHIFQDRAARAEQVFRVALGDG
mmetsp:Transcript_67975/g.208282  ORF Transcript_67975/g.208282 Transcript_67975/m.208282 type:complete len:275 (+) Transcript_67975:711-1535(+)